MENWKTRGGRRRSSWARRNHNCIDQSAMKRHRKPPMTSDQWQLLRQGNEYPQAPSVMKTRSWWVRKCRQLSILQKIHMTLVLLANRQFIVPSRIIHKPWTGPKLVRKFCGITGRRIKGEKFEMIHHSGAVRHLSGFVIPNEVEDPNGSFNLGK